MYDCIVIGTGAAGVSAALTLKALKINFLLLGSKTLSPKIRGAEKIKNYPGMPDVSGEEMTGIFSAQLKAEGIEICEGKANGIYPADDGFNVLCGGDVYEGRTVILATGVEALKPVRGEAEFLGKGVSYCAVCDGFLYRDKTIAVALESAEDAHEVELLAKYARKVYLFCGKKKVDISAGNVENCGRTISAVVGDERVRAVISGGEEIAVDGVFFIKSAIAADNLLSGLETRDGHVAVNRDLSTNIAGVFAAGDVTGRPFQYAKAVGEGNVCAYSVNAYLNGLKSKAKVKEN